jgi:hypothetical protein
MYKVKTYQDDCLRINYFSELHDAKHFAVDNAYEGFESVIYEDYLPSHPKRLYRTERFGNCFGVVPL